MVSVAAAGLVALVVLGPLHYLLSLARNYRLAKATGLPVRINLINNTNPLWILASDAVWRLLTRWGLGDLVRFNHVGWEFHEKHKPHAEMGSAFISVTPGENWMSLADPGAISQVLAGERKGEYVRPPVTIKMLGVFGPNVSTTAGADGARMRKATIAAFNESTNGEVWIETLRQARQILAYWLSFGDKGTITTANDTQAFAFNAMLRAGFGAQADFEPSESVGAGTHHPTTGQMYFKTALQLVLHNAVLILAIGPTVVPKLGILSKHVATLGESVAAFKQYMVDMLRDEKQHGMSTKIRGNILSNLARASVDGTLRSEEELFGNMFVYLFAGHDTTALSLASTFVLLSVHPEVQDWVREELDAVLPHDHSTLWAYEEVYPRLKRVLAVQYETIRLYNPVLGVIKATADKPMPLTLDGGTRTVQLPARANIVINVNGVHTDPEIYGPDAMEWRPQRWIRAAEDGKEHLLVPDKNRFVGWGGDGMRQCPGKKFGHVEHVGLMAVLLQNHCVKAFAEGNETPAQTKARYVALVDDGLWNLNMGMRHPEKARVRWERI